jgi:cytochrome c-type biogenesis protein CcmH/NrfG
LKKCRAQLTRDGLDQYRKGNLKEAIAIWQGLLQFDPDNAEIRKAVDTATEQLKKLQKR